MKTRFSQTIVTTQGIHGSLVIWNDGVSDFELYDITDFCTWPDQTESDLAIAREKAKEYDLREVSLETFFYETEIEVAPIVLEQYGFDFYEWHEGYKDKAEACGEESDDYQQWLGRFTAVLRMNDSGKTTVQFKENGQLIGDSEETGDDSATREMMETLANVAHTVAETNKGYGLIATQKEIESLGFNFPDDDDAEGFSIASTHQGWMLVGCAKTNDPYQIFTLTAEDVELLALNLPGGFNVHHIGNGREVETIY